LALLRRLRTTFDELLEPTLELAPLDQHPMLAAFAYESDICPQSHYLPTGAAARVRLGEGKAIANTKLDRWIRHGRFRKAMPTAKVPTMSATTRPSMSKRLVGSD